MDFLSQNKKILLSTMSILVVSIAILLLFTTTNEEAMKSGHANVSGYTHENTLSEQELSFSNYLEQNENTWFVTDVSGKYIDVSDDFCSLLGKKAEEIRGMLLFSDINAKDLPAIMSENSKMLLEAKKIEGLGPYRLIKNDKEELLVIFKAVPIVNKETNKVSKIIFSVKDISKIVEETKIKDKE